MAILGAQAVAPRPQNLISPEPRHNMQFQEEEEHASPINKSLYPKP